MKWVFYVLVALNIWYFSTHISALQPEPLAVAPPPPPSNAVNRLLMLKELEAGELKERGQSAAETVAVAAPVAVSTSGSSLSRATEQPKPQTAQTVGAAAGESPPPASVASNLPEGICYSFGPLGEDVAIAAIREWLAERGGIAELRERERRELSRYWVYFPPFPSRAQAVNRVDGMRTKGIDDIFIIPRGDMGNAISLGVYSRRDSLNRRLNELRRKGYEPSVAPRYKTERATWLDAVFPKSSNLDVPAFNSAFSGIEVGDFNCTPDALAKLPKLARANVSKRGKVEPSTGAQPAPATPAVSTQTAPASSESPERPTQSQGGSSGGSSSDATPVSGESAERVVSTEAENYNAPQTRRPYQFSSPSESRVGGQQGSQAEPEATQLSVPAVTAPQ